VTQLQDGVGKNNTPKTKEELFQYPIPWKILSSVSTHTHTHGLVDAVNGFPVSTSLSLSLPTDGFGGDEDACLDLSIHQIVVWGGREFFGGFYLSIASC